MGLPVEVNNLMLGSLGGYTVGRSLRFRSSASAYLNRTPASTGNQKIWTFSVWVKRGAISTISEILHASNTVVNQFFFQFNSDNTITFSQTNNTSTFNLVTSQVFRDPSAWYHLVAVYNSPDATASNRMSLYVNGVKVTAFSTASYPSQNFDSLVNLNNLHVIGSQKDSVYTNFFDGYIAEVNLIDGQALTPSSFGAYDTNGVWQPKKYTGTYGTNGFYLPFSNTTSTTTLVQDSSGNGNNWTPNNISLTAGTTYDSMIDSPTNSASSSNYAVMNPLDSLSGTASNGNLLWTAGAAQSDIRGTIAIPSSGKFYMECTVGSTTNASSAASFGLATSTVALNSSNAVSGLYQLYASSSGYLSLNGTNVSSSLGVWTAGDILQIAVDVDNTKMWLGKNNTWYDSSGGSTGNPSTGANATSTTSMVGLFPFSNCYSNNVTWNMGQRPFTYTPPSGYKALNTYNLPAPSIANSAQYMAATLWSGNNVNGTAISNSQSNGGNNPLGTTFAPDLVWVKSRSGAYYHMFQDTIRGAGKSIFSNITDAESGNSGDLLGAFQSTGFTVNRNYTGQTTNPTTNNSGDTYVGWQWKAGGTGVSNNSGTITSTVSASPSSGFSIATYTGTGANATVGHGLGVAPNLIIVKARSTAGQNWLVYSSVLGATQYLILDLTNAAGTASTPWNNTAPTSSVFSIGTSAGSNNNGTTYVAYCFAAVRGYSAFGSGTGNASSDGPFIYTGFRPRFIMAKNSSGTSDWYIWDSSRNTYNTLSNLLYPNLINAEFSSAGDNLDILSNGFKWRGSGNVNGAGNTFIWAAFAEVPFNYSRGR